jgi:ribosomal protein L18E
MILLLSKSEIDHAGDVIRTPHPKGTVCEGIRGIYMASSDREVRERCVRAFAFAKKVSGDLQRYKRDRREVSLESIALVSRMHSIVRDEIILISGVISSDKKMRERYIEVLALTRKIGRRIDEYKRRG